MADLSAYIHFSVVLNKAANKIQVTDNSAYPGGVKQLVKGVLSITQPDGITVSNANFNAPDIAWTGSNLNIALKDLRLATDGSFQNGAYRITYTVRAAGFTDTVLTQNFVLNYEAPKLVINQNFDVFTPNLSAQDGTNYTQDNLVYLSTQWQWSATIVSVQGTNQNLTGSSSNFDLAWDGQYFDSQYQVVLTVLPSYQIAALNPFVTIVDQLSLAATLNAQIPPTIPALMNLLSQLKLQLDAAMCDCNTYSILRMRYLSAQAIFRQMRDRGIVGDLSGLSLYVLQLEKLLNNNVTPTYINTDQVIPPYDWGAGGGTSVVNWSDIQNKPFVAIWEWVVDGAGAGPGDGASIFSDARMAGFFVRVFRSGLKQLSFDPTDGSSYYVKNFSDNFLTFFPALAAGEYISVETIPLSND